MEMEDTVEVILEFLKKHNFMKAERALRDELSATNVVDELPRLPPVRLQLGSNTNFESARDENSTRSFDSAVFLSMTNTPEGFFGLGSFLDVPVGQDVASSGMKDTCGGEPASEGMLEDVSDRLSGFATAGDGEGESAVDYPCQHWDSDAYEDDDDPGYHRQPIEDEAWFLAHEIDHPSEDERARNVNMENGGHLDVNLGKSDGDIRYVMEEESSLSGEGYGGLREAELRSNEKESAQLNLDGLAVLNDNIACGHEGELIDSEALDLFKGKNVYPCLSKDPRGELGKNVWDDCGEGHCDYSLELSSSFLGPPRSYARLDNGDAAVSGSECMASESSEGFTENSGGGESDDQGSMHGRYWQNLSFREDLGSSAVTQLESNDAAVRPVEDDYEEEDMHLLYYNDPVIHKRQSLKLQLFEQDSQEHGPDCSIANQKCKSERPSLSSSMSKEALNMGIFEHSNLSSQTTNDYLCLEAKEEGDADHDINKQSGCQDLVAAEDEEMAALQDQTQRTGSEEDEYEVFDLKIIHRKNRTGFEEEKDLSVVINSVIAGRYHVREYLGSAAFSKAIQAHDLHTGMDVCMKIIKNNKDFFDQSLDEIKLLKYVNKHDPADKYHILRLYDYFYHREHLFIVCELLRANLYEFQKFNKESGGEAYFTMPRLQSITRQCLEALEFLHALGLIHCDLKPENILVKSYSRCEVKVIDLGSSCFQTDHLCSYVQSRSYRAPEVILGLPYDQKIDIWSLGCILAELCSGNVLFQNDSLATLLARMIGILGPIDPEMLAKGRDIHKYFTKNHVLYERIQETEQLEYILPKKTSLSHRLPLGDHGFVEFVGYLLQINPLHRPTAKEALMHPWLSYPYEPISA